MIHKIPEEQYKNLNKFPNEHTCKERHYHNFEYKKYLEETKNNEKLTDNSSNGLITKIWGNPGWDFLHSVTFGYPINPTDEDKEDYMKMFSIKGIGRVLPCSLCRASYVHFITTKGSTTELTWDVMESRETLTKWLYNVHNAVNNKLEFEYLFTYEDLVEKFESFRARCHSSSGNKNLDLNNGLKNYPLCEKQNQINKQTKQEQKGCVVPNDYKKFSYHKYYDIEAAVIPLNICIKLLPYAKAIIPKALNFIKYAFSCPSYCKFIKSTNNMENYLDFYKDFKKNHISLWKERNDICNKIIKYMKLNSIPSHVNYTLTVHELILIMHFSSNLPKSDLIKACDTLMKNRKLINFRCI